MWGGPAEGSHCQNLRREDGIQAEGSQTPPAAEQFVASPRTVGLQGLRAWMGSSVLGRDGAQIGLRPEVTGRETDTLASSRELAGTQPSEGLPGTYLLTLQSLSCLP